MPSPSVAAMPAPSAAKIHVIESGPEPPPVPVSGGWMTPPGPPIGVRVAVAAGAPGVDTVAAAVAVRVGVCVNATWVGAPCVGVGHTPPGHGVGVLVGGRGVFVGNGVGVFVAPGGGVGTLHVIVPSTANVTMFS